MKSIAKKMIDVLIIILLINLGSIVFAQDDSLDIGKSLENKNVKYLDIDTLFPFASECINDKGDRDWGYIDKHGKMVIIPKFARTYVFTEGLAVVKDKNSGKYGYINKLGEYVISPKFELAHPFSQGLAAVKYNNKFYYIDYQGNIIINNIQVDMKKVRSMVDVSENTTIEIGDCYQFNEEGYAKIEILVSKQSDFSTNSSRIPYLINRKGEVFASKIDFVSIHNFSEGRVKFTSNKRLAQGYFKEGYLDKNGKELDLKIEPYIYMMGNFYEDRATFRSKNTYKYGYIDKNGNVVIEPIFYNAEQFNNGMAKVEILKDDKVFVGFINKSGQYIIEPKFEYTPTKMVFGSGYDEVMQESLFPDEQLYTFSERLSPFQSLRKFGYINKNGKVIIEAKYKFAKKFINGLAIVQTLDDQFIYIDKDGNFVGYYFKD